MDLTKALTLNGEVVLDKPIKVEKAKVKHEDKVKVKASAEDKKGNSTTCLCFIAREFKLYATCSDLWTCAVILAKRDARCLFLKNVPFNATKEDILKIFRKAVDVRFPGGTDGPTKGWEF